MSTSPSPALTLGSSSLQLYRLDLGHESAAVVAQDGRHDAEDGITKGVDVQDRSEDSRP